MRNRWWTHIAIAAGVVAVTVLPADGQTPDEVCMANAQPANLDFTFEDLDGNAITLGDYAGKVILLDFWATWCGPCRFLIPGFIELYQEFGSQGLQVVGLSVDDSVSELRPYVEEMGMNYPVLVGEGRLDVQEAYGPLIGLPTAFIIDREGRICRSHTGFAEKELFEETIRALL